jgi:hypothetical protein
MYTMPHRRFRIVAPVQNTHNIIIASGTLEDNPTYMEAYEFDGTDPTVSGAPGLKAYRLIAGYGSP